MRSTERVLVAAWAMLLGAAVFLPTLVPAWPPPAGVWPFVGASAVVYSRVLRVPGAGVRRRRLLAGISGRARDGPRDARPLGGAIPGRATLAGRSARDRHDPLRADRPRRGAAVVAGSPGEGGSESGRRRPLTGSDPSIRTPAGDRWRQLRAHARGSGSAFPRRVLHLRILDAGRRRGSPMAPAAVPGARVRPFRIGLRRHPGDPGRKADFSGPAYAHSVPSR